jgi:hypothetical protein
VKAENEKPAKNPSKRKIKIFNRDFFVFVFFLVFSFAMWYLNSLGKEAEADIRYPVRFVNLPKERIIADDSPVKLNLFFKGPGYSILKLRLSGTRTPLAIDLSKVNYRRVPGSKTPGYYIITSGLGRTLAVQLRPGCEITAIKPDTLFFTLERITSASSQGTENDVLRNRARER